MKFLSLILAACSTPESLPPNIIAICERGIECGVFTKEQIAACVACLEHWAEQINDDIEAQLPSPHTIDCMLLQFVADNKRISECVAEEWWNNH